MQRTIQMMLLFSFLAILLQYLTIPNYIYPFQILPNNLVISWYHLVSTMHQVSLPVQYQYHHCIVTIWYWQFCVHLVLILMSADHQVHQYHYGISTIEYWWFHGHLVFPLYWFWQFSEKTSMLSPYQTVQPYVRRLPTAELTNIRLTH